MLELSWLYPKVNSVQLFGSSTQTRLPANQQGSKLLKKFSSYLTEGSLKALKRFALETDRKDYEVLQEAVDRYLQHNK